MKMCFSFVFFVFFFVLNTRSVFGQRPTLSFPDRLQTLKPELSLTAETGLTNPGLTNPGLTNPGLTNPGLTNPGCCSSSRGG